MMPVSKCTTPTHAAHIARAHYSHVVAVTPLPNVATLAARIAALEAENARLLATIAQQDKAAAALKVDAMQGRAEALRAGTRYTEYAKQWALTVTMLRAKLHELGVDPDTVTRPQTQGV